MVGLRSLLAASAALFGLWGLAAGPVHAQEGPQWLVRLGLYPLQPQEHPHSQLELGDATALALEGTWMFAPRWGLELMAAAPVEHDLYVNGAGKAGALRHAPAAFTLQRRFFDPNGRVQAYVGAGVARSAFSGERTYGALEGVELDVDAAHGLTVQVGLDLALESEWFVALGGRWFDFDADAAIGGQGIGVLELDPYMIGLALGRALP